MSGPTKALRVHPYARSRVLSKLLSPTSSLQPFPYKDAAYRCHFCSKTLVYVLIEPASRHVPPRKAKCELQHIPLFKKRTPKNNHYD